MRLSSVQCLSAIPCRAVRGGVPAWRGGMPPAVLPDALTIPPHRKANAKQTQANTKQT